MMFGSASNDPSPAASDAPPPTPVRHIDFGSPENLVTEEDAQEAQQQPEVSMEGEPAAAADPEPASLASSATLPRAPLTDVKGRGGMTSRIFEAKRNGKISPSAIWTHHATLMKDRGPEEAKPKAWKKFQAKVADANNFFQTRANDVAEYLDEHWPRA